MNFNRIFTLVIENNLVEYPLHVACKKGLMELVFKLIANGADINEKDDVFGDTPLHMACKNGHMELAFKLIAPPPTILISASGLSFNLISTEVGAKVLLTNRTLNRF